MDFKKKTTLGRTGLKVARLGISSSFGAPAAAFEEAFEAKFPGKQPAICANYFYDATNLAILAMKNGGDTGPQINEAMAKIKDFPGVTGGISFTEIGDRVAKVRVKKVEGGKLVDTGYTDSGE